MTHIQTPLHTDGSFIYSDDNTVAVMINSVFVTDDQRERAAHIVKCVNTHDELVEALKLASQMLFATGNSQNEGYVHIKSVIDKAQ